jgi:hypothetical protein
VWAWALVDRKDIFVSLVVGSKRHASVSGTGVQACPHRDSRRDKRWGSSDKWARSWLWGHGKKWLRAKPACTLNPNTSQKWPISLFTMPGLAGHW